ncbi:MAG: multidrug transporter [Faecalibacterium sp.]|nr:multidrug transporter [Faecalibacterium sp.]
MGFSKKDWTLFKEKIAVWQENRMAKLCSEYIELLRSSAPSSEKIWALEERLRHDKRNASVWVRMNRSEMPFIILRLLDEGTITTDDLAEFSDERKAYAEFHIKNSFH